MRVTKMEFKNYVYLTLLLCYLSIVTAQRTPTISHITQEQIRDIGSQVDLDCSVHYAQDFPVIWVKYDSYKTVESIPLSTNAGLIIKDSRFSLRFDDATATYTLSIKDIQENDAGWYQCQVLMSVSNKITAEVELQVRRPPIISDNSTRSIVANEGESVQMECYAGGFPPPKISWRRENNAILPTGGSIYRGNILKIATVHKEDRGTYYCVAENGVGKGARRNINLEVEFAPVVTVPRPRLAQALQYDMDLECHVEAYPPPAITWLKDEIQLSNNQHYRISHFATADEFTDTTIRVITIEKRQYGLFKCKAQNKLGTDEGQVELVESIIPVCPPACGTARFAAAASLAPSVATLMSLFAVYIIYAVKRVAYARH
nr:lachesin isoform X1 [Helicoverpa armigera]